MDRREVPAVVSTGRFSTAVRVEQGNPELQDCAEIVELGSSLLVVLADGAGGHSNARQTAQAVIRTIRQRADALALTDPDQCRTLLLAVDREAAKAGGESTGVFVLLAKGSTTGASVGDSEAWIIEGEKITAITEQQRRKPCLGTGAISATSFRYPPLTGTLLVASDGLFKYTSREAILNVVKNTDLELVARNLVELVRYPSGQLPDDVSLVLVRPG